MPEQKGAKEQGNEPAPRGTSAKGVGGLLPDVVVGIAATLLTLPTLLFPFGRDQGLYFYVAREWVERGAVPYRDVLDHKTPGIYFLHALAILLFGAKESSIRILEAIGVLGFGFLAASSMTRVGDAHPRGIRGFGMLTAVLLYFGFFDFWSSAQSEVWYAGVGIAAVWAARRIRSVELATVTSCILAGAVPVIKPPGLGFAVVALVVLFLRVRKEPLLSGRRVRFRLASIAATGLVAIPGLVLAYFGATRALPAMRDIVVGANAYYVKHEVGAVGSLFAHYKYVLWVFLPFTPVFLGSALVHLGRALRRRDLALAENEAIGLGFVAAATAAVTVQGKFYFLHWGCFPLALAFLACAAYVRISSLTRAEAWAPVSAAAFMTLGYVSTAWISNAATVQRDTLNAEYRYLSGQYDLPTFQARFQVAPIGFFYADSYALGKWLESHTAPTDTVTVRGFQPEVYAVANRHHHGRFFWTTFLVNPARAYKREEWTAEDARDLREHPPRYLVALTDVHDGLDSPEYYETRGYRRVTTFPGYTVMEPK